MLQALSDHFGFPITAQGKMDANFTDKSSNSAASQPLLPTHAHLTPPPAFVPVNTCSPPPVLGTVSHSSAASGSNASASASTPVHHGPTPPVLLGPTPPALGTVSHSSAASVSNASLDALLTAASLNHVAAAIADLGVAEVADFVDVTDEDLQECGLKKIEIKRLRRHLAGKMEY
jgi:hypothetical protein